MLNTLDDVPISVGRKRVVGIENVLHGRKKAPLAESVTSRAKRNEEEPRRAPRGGAGTKRGFLPKFTSG
jgi:hypothetical protein